MIIIPLRVVEAWPPDVSSVPHPAVAVWPTGHSVVAADLLLVPGRGLCLINH